VEPSTITLTYRLIRTTEASVSNRADNQFCPLDAIGATATTGEDAAKIFARHGEPKRV
jgi:hypothetical protein